ncbi:LuxR C-terminal-related transcriptional regulator [Streptomyces sp. B6B3]|uniref:helix-turn-helix transcriptional regulator n=1 Tax=Streptomyces sp. B6B3 TaxID=3153570 RepID=UPI00325DCD06
MAGVRERDYEQMLELATDVLNGRAGVPPWAHVLAELGRALHTTTAGLTRANWERREGSPEAWSPNDIGTRRMAEISRRLMRAGHPLARHYATTPDTEPRTGAEVMGEAAWRDSRVASLSRELHGAGHVMSIPLPGRTRGLRGFVLYHADADGDFTEEERAYALRVQPLLVAVDAHQRQLERWRAMVDRAGATGGAAEARAKPRAEERARQYKLTPREVVVLKLLAESLPAVAIGHRLGISTRTVHKHVEHLYRKLEVSDRLSAVMRAQAFGLLPEGRPGPDGTGPAELRRPPPPLLPSQCTLTDAGEAIGCRGAE